MNYCYAFYTKHLQASIHHYYLSYIPFWHLIKSFPATRRSQYAARTPSKKTDDYDDNDDDDHDDTMGVCTKQMNGSVLSNTAVKKISDSKGLITATASGDES